MANSRKPRCLTKSAAADVNVALTDSLVIAFERALEEILARVVISGDSGIALAYSGGLDSSVLLALASRYCKDKAIPLYAFHIHHGLSPNADAWLAHCEQQAMVAGVKFVAQRVSLTEIDQHGIEQAARIARYEALTSLCDAHQISLLLTAHHQDDQAETVLLQLLRGAGLPGLSGMSLLHEDHALLHAGLALGRPLLAHTRLQLEALAQYLGISSINDESNTDTRYRRNAVRQLIAPVIETSFPGFAAQVARSSSHVQTAQRLLDELAAIDLLACEHEGSLALTRLAGLSADRIDNLLRHWLLKQGLSLPSTAQLMQLRSQMLGASTEAHPLLRLSGATLERRAGFLTITDSYRDAAPPTEPVTLRWQGEAEMLIPEWQGKLVFETGSSHGFDRKLLEAGPLALRPRTGSERLKLAANRPSRTLKNLYQESQIPARERPWLPLLYVGETLAFAAGLGIDRRLGLVEQGVSLRWEPLLS